MFVENKIKLKERKGKKLIKEWRERKKKKRKTQKCVCVALVVGGLVSVRVCLRV